MSSYLTYAIRDEDFVHISEVDNGLKCNCICPNCKSKLIARNNIKNKREHHFAHYNCADCSGAIESAIHLLAKRIIFENKKIYLPDYHFDYNINNNKSLYQKGSIQDFDEIFLEVSKEVNNQRFVPDVIGLKNGKELLIEFAYTHFIDDDKTKKLNDSKLPCFEVFLNEQILDYNSLKSFLIESNLNRKWIINTKMDRKYLKEKEEKAKEKRKKQKRKLERIKEEKIKAKEFEIQEKLNSEEEKRNNDRLRRQGYSIIDKDYFRCPKKFEDLRINGFDKHPVLQRILKGEYWNKEIYGRGMNPKYIFMKNEKIFIYQGDFDIKSPEEKRLSNFFFKGLKKIQEINHYCCENCDLLFNINKYNGKIICRYQQKKNRG